MNLVDFDVFHEEILKTKKKIKIIHSNRITKDGDILPIIQNNFLKTRLSNLVEMNSNTTKLPLTFNYSPISIGKLRLILHVEHAMRSLKQFGFTRKDVDEVKGIFSEANLYLLCGTMLIASVHVSKWFLSDEPDGIKSDLHIFLHEQF